MFVHKTQNVTPLVKHDAVVGSTGRGSVLEPAEVHGGLGLVCYLVDVRFANVAVGPAAGGERDPDLGVPRVVLVYELEIGPFRPLLSGIVHRNASRAGSRKGRKESICDGLRYGSGGSQVHSRRTHVTNIPKIGGLGKDGTFEASGFQPGLSRSIVDIGVWFRDGTAGFLKPCGSVGDFVGHGEAAAKTLVTGGLWGPSK